MRPKTPPKNSKLSPIYPPSKELEKYPPTMQLHEHPSSQCIASSQWLISSCAGASTLPISQTARSRKIHIVILLVTPKQIIISNNALLFISREIKCIVSDNIQGIASG